MSNCSTKQQKNKTTRKSKEKGKEKHMQHVQFSTLKCELDILEKYE